MKHSSFCKGMAKLQAKGVSKQQAFNRMKNLSKKSYSKDWVGRATQKRDYEVSASDIQKSYDMGAQGRTQAIEMAYRRKHNLD